MKRPTLFFSLICALLVLGSLPLIARAMYLVSSTYVVDRLSDGNPTGDGEGIGLTGDLRYAITHAQTGDHIIFSVIGTISLGGNLPSLTRNISIDGPGANKLIVDGAGGSVFVVNSGTTLVLSGIAITGGVGNGGGILNSGMLTLNNITVTGNSAGDATNGGGTGAGIWNYVNATLTMNNSTVSGNMVFGNSSYNLSRGGGVANYGTLTMNNSTVSGNSASEGSGGGISNTLPTSTLTLNNSTISGNFTTGVVGIAGGIDNHGTFNAVNTIIAGNTGSQVPDIFGTLNSLGHNLIGNTNGGSGFRPDLGDLLNVNPLLGSLQNNGGSTETMALLVGSPAVDAGDDVICTSTDQRGVTRPQGAHCDIGAYEGAVSSSNTVTPTPTYTPSATGTVTQTATNTPTNTATNTPTDTLLHDLDTVGVFRPSNGLLYLKNLNITGFADVAINYGLGGDYPIVGDWDGNGTATIGIYRNGSFYLRNSNTLGFADLVFAFGQPGDQPIAGDWNGDGIDTIGVYRSSTGQFLLRNCNSAGAPDMSFYLGNVGDVGIAGDWNGDGMDTAGVFRPSNGVIFLKNANTTGFADVALNYGMAGDQPVTGDWNGDEIDTIGVYRNGQFLLRNSNTIGFADMVFGLGNPGDIPIAGNWDGMP